MPDNSTLRQRWRSRKHVGQWRPRQVVKIQRGWMRRSYSPFLKLDGSRPRIGEISRARHPFKPWHAEWHADGPWITLPNVMEVSLEEQVGVDGVSDPETCTIQIENILYDEVEGDAGSYHKIIPGGMAPFFGFFNPARPIDPDAQRNEWYEVLTSGCRVKIWQGYGDRLRPTFLGMIDEADVRAMPRQITVTCRSAGQLLTDQRVAGKVKAKEIKGPITFADRKRVFHTEKVGRNARASSEMPGHEAKWVGPGKSGHDREWMSRGREEDNRDNHTEYVEIELKEGIYNTYYLEQLSAGVEAWCSIYVKPLASSAPATYGGVEVPEGWIDVGKGDVPGIENGGEPWVQHFHHQEAKGKFHKLPLRPLRCGKGTILRMSFRHLHYYGTTGKYHVKVRQLCAIAKIEQTDARNKHWILVNDASDVVKWVLMWAGFREWNVERLGVRLKNPMTFHQGDYLIDIIRHIVSQGNFIFHIDPPTDREGSMGVPVFRRSRAVALPQPGMEEVRSTDLLTGVETKFSKEPLAYVIRARGKASKTGRDLFEDRIKRFQGEYFPPWSGHHRNLATGKKSPEGPGRLAGIVKHVTHYDNALENENECKMAALLIAVQQALAAYQGTIEVPGWPRFRLDNLISIVDTPTGTNARMWIAHKSSTFIDGENVEYTTTLQGAFLDSPDLLRIALDYWWLLQVVEAEYRTDDDERYDGDRPNVDFSGGPGQSDYEDFDGFDGGPQTLTDGDYRDT